MNSFAAPNRDVDEALLRGDGLNNPNTFLQITQDNTNVHKYSRLIFLDMMMSRIECYYLLEEYNLMCWCWNSMSKKWQDNFSGKYITTNEGNY